MKLLRGCPESMKVVFYILCPESFNYTYRNCSKIVDKKFLEPKTLTTEHNYFKYNRKSKIEVCGELTQQEHKNWIKRNRNIFEKRQAAARRNRVGGRANAIADNRENTPTLEYSIL
jgi:hypothetical protein